MLNKPTYIAETQCASYIKITAVNELHYIHRFRARQNNAKKKEANRHTD